MTECLYTLRKLYARRLDALHFFSVENQRLEYLLQRFYSSMRFRNESVCTEIFLNRIKQNRMVFTRFSSVWTGPQWINVRQWSWIHQIFIRFIPLSNHTHILSRKVEILPSDVGWVKEKGADWPRGRWERRPASPPPAGWGLPASGGPGTGRRAEFWRAVCPGPPSSRACVPHSLHRHGPLHPGPEMQSQTKPR